MKKIVIFLVNIYRYAVSPLFPPTCRFTPTCSAYFIEAVNKYGVVKGVTLGLWRILRCNPWNKGGFDPVP